MERVGLGVVRASSLDRLRRLQNRDAGDLEFLLALEGLDRESALTVFSLSSSQTRQDLLALSLFGAEVPGFFVEFGATDGIHLSNSYLLETNFGWRGILAEPAQVWHKRLRKNRSSLIDIRAVTAVSGEEVNFHETKTAELSHLEQVGVSSPDGATTDTFRTYRVQTVSLNDLLHCHGAPVGFNYLSIDTEGGEAEIIESFDVEFWKVGLITVEHNFGASRALVRESLESRGYHRVLPEFSAQDDWFVRTELLWAGAS